ncbi:MAG: hypothetical protein IPH59_15240 [bacterium]|nr:hypothetical protein [bacterium]
MTLRKIALAIITLTVVAAFSAFGEDAKVESKGEPAVTRLFIPIFKDSASITAVQPAFPRSRPSRISTSRSPLPKE